MTYEQYWNDDVCLVKYYIKAHELKRKERNAELWRQGLYVYEAVGALAPVLHAFSKSGARPMPYVREPYPLDKKDADEYKKRQEDRQKAEFKEKMNLWKTDIDCRIGGDKSG